MNQNKYHLRLPPCSMDWTATCRWWRKFSAERLLWQHWKINVSFSTTGVCCELKKTVTRKINCFGCTISYVDLIYSNYLEERTNFSAELFWIYSVFGSIHSLLNLFLKNHCYSQRLRVQAEKSFFVNHMHCHRVCGPNLKTVWKLCKLI